VPGSIGYVIWSLASLLELCVVVCALARHSFRRYLFLNLYMLLSLLVSLLRYQVLSHFGLRSSEYKYFLFLFRCSADDFPVSSADHSLFVRILMR